MGVIGLFLVEIIRCLEDGKHWLESYSMDYFLEIEKKKHGTL